MWKKNFGVEVKLQNQEWKIYIDSCNIGNFDVICVLWVGDYNELFIFLLLLIFIYSGNILCFNDLVYDKIFVQVVVENLVKVCNDDYNVVEKIIMVKVLIVLIYQYING